MSTALWESSRSVVWPPRPNEGDAYAIAALRFPHERQGASLLARAFVDDPLVCAICDVPDDEREWRITWSFRMALRRHCLSGQRGWTVADSTAGTVGVVLMSQPVGSVHGGSDSWFTLRALTHIGPRAVLRGMHAGRVIAAHAPPGPFTYLRTLGIDPGFRNRGLGSRLVAEVLRHASPAWPVYLETAKEENLHFYARHGMTCIGEFRCLGVRVWRLLRPTAHGAPPRRFHLG